MYDNFNRKKPQHIQRSGATRSKQGQNKDKADARPITSYKGAGFQSNLQENNEKNIIKLVNLEPKENKIEAKCKILEKDLQRLIDESAYQSKEGNYGPALTLAKEAQKKEKQLRRLRENSGTIEQYNPDLMYYVAFNLANQYEKNNVPEEALDYYTTLVKNKNLQNSGRFRVNMGNIYYSQKKFSMAVKMYRMALDKLPKEFQSMRNKILKNIGHAFVKIGKFQEAIISYETVMEEVPDFQAAFNLILCLYALGDIERMKACYVNMLNIEIPGLFEEEEGEEYMEKKESDNLMEDLKDRKRQACNYLIKAAKLIAPSFSDDEIEGYN